MKKSTEIRLTLFTFSSIVIIVVTLLIRPDIKLRSACLGIIFNAAVWYVVPNNFLKDENGNYLDKED